VCVCVKERNRERRREIIYNTMAKELHSISE